MRMQVEPTAEAVVMEVEDQVTATGTPPLVDKDLVAQLVGDAQRLGLSVEGEGGLLAQLTKLVLESALEGEMTAHLGYDKHERVEGSDNARNGTRSKTVLTKAGPVEIAVPRDRAGSFEPVVVAKRQRRLGAIEDVVLSLSARGLTHGDIAAHLADVYGSEVSKTTISTITDKVLDSMGEWQNRPLDPVYPVVFIDAIHVKVRDGQVANRPIYVALAVTVEGNRDILGLWAGDGGEGAKYWQQVLTEIKNRGVADVLMLVCDGLKGLPESVGNVWPQTIVQTCVVHLIRGSFRYAARQDWDKLARALRPIYSKHGFALSFDEADTPKPEHIRILCHVSHTGGHTRTYHRDMPADGKGAKGGDVMTKTHAAGAAASYAMRYLLRGIFNVAVGEEDRDGNAPPENGAPITVEQRAELLALISETDTDVALFCKYFKIDAVPDLPAAKFATAKARLVAKKDA